MSLLEKVTAVIRALLIEHGTQASPDHDIDSTASAAADQAIQAVRAHDAEEAGQAAPEPAETATAV